MNLGSYYRQAILSLGNMGGGNVFYFLHSNGVLIQPRFVYDSGCAKKNRILASKDFLGLLLSQEVLVSVVYHFRLNSHDLLECENEAYKIQHACCLRDYFVTKKQG